MKKLLNQYSFNSDMQYYEMIAESFLNGQITQAKSQFEAMPKANRVSMVQAANGYWESSMDKGQINILVGLI
jgi:hypothetical protein